MTKLYVSNAFSLSMLDRKDPDLAMRAPVPIEDPALFATQARFNGREIVSIIGHANTAAIFSGIIGVELPANRESIKLIGDDALLVGQYVGPRLPEGATELPEGASIEWWLI